jgi:hypothetical protein
MLEFFFINAGPFRGLSLALKAPIMALNNIFLFSSSFKGFFPELSSWSGKGLMSFSISTQN